MATSNRIGLVTLVLLVAIAVVIFFQKPKVSNERLNDRSLVVTPARPRLSPDQPEPVNDPRELIAHYTDGGSRPRYYSYIEVVPDLARRCYRSQIVCQGSLEESDFREVGNELFVYAPPNCEALPPENGLADRTWTINRTFQEVPQFKRSRLREVPDGSVVPDYDRWPPCELQEHREREAPELSSPQMI